MGLCKDIAGPANKDLLHLVPSSSSARVDGAWPFAVQQNSGLTGYKTLNPTNA